VTFNSNGTDGDAISTGAKDDMDYATVLKTAPVAKALGIDTFILDDGWQAISGDWEPDSPQHPEPRWDGTPTSPFKPRFPDDSFAAVRQAIAPMKLGLWMSPMHFNPASATLKAHPDWACAPLGLGTTALNVAQPDSSSNEAGIGAWGPKAIPHIESRIREAITEWQVAYFKFDFLMWSDCAGQGTMHDFQDAFVAMLDRLRADHPDVTFQIDETNDYRLFPFASVSRGPSWFQNGTPTPDRLLHNLWNLAPWIPTESLGQHFLGGRQYETYPVDTLMAAALLSHPTFFSDLRTLPPSVVEQAAPWTRFYAEHRELLTEGVTYPLLEDPLKNGWTALQTWDPDRARGALLAFRQGAATDRVTVALRGVPDDRVFDLYDGPDGVLVGQATSAELQQGIEVVVPDKDGAKVLLVQPAG
jgi:alpha-galactosidase